MFTINDMKNPNMRFWMGVLAGALVTMALSAVWFFAMGPNSDYQSSSIRDSKQSEKLVPKLQERFSVPKSQLMPEPKGGKQAMPEPKGGKQAMPLPPGY